MIGIDISKLSVKIVRLSNNSQRKLLTFCWHDIPPNIIEKGVIKDEKGMRKLLAEALKKCSLSTNINDSIVASIPEAESFLRVLEIPAMDESEISEAVRWEVAQHIPFGIENVYIDWQWVTPDPDKETARREVLVGAAEKGVVNTLYNVLASLNLDVAALELESQAITRALISPELKTRKGLLIVDLGAAKTNVVIHDHGTIRFTATLQKGVDELLLALSAEQRSLISGPPKKNRDEELITELTEHLLPGLNELMVEIHGIVEFYTRIDSGHGVNEILLTGGGSNLPGLDKVFLRYFDNVHTQRGNPWVNIIAAGKDISTPMNLTESVHYSTALGLALRPIIL